MYQIRSIATDIFKPKNGIPWALTLIVPSLASAVKLMSPELLLLVLPASTDMPLSDIAGL